jgi:hypothetical protein
LRYESINKKPYVVGNSGCGCVAGDRLYVVQRAYQELSKSNALRCKEVMFWTSSSGPDANAGQNILFCSLSCVKSVHQNYLKDGKWTADGRQMNGKWWTSPRS